MNRAIAVLACLACLTAASEAHSRQAYCFAPVEKTGSKLERAFGKQCTTYVSPIFASDDSEYLLAAEFSQALPDAGLATCVTDELTPDLQGSWQGLLDGIKADNCTVSMQPPPAAAPSPPGQ